MPTCQKTPTAREDDAFELHATPGFSPETLSRGTRYATDDERARLLMQLSARCP